MQRDPWWEAVNRLEALLLGLLPDEVYRHAWDRRPDVAAGLPLQRQVAAGYVVSCSELLDFAVPFGDWPGVPATR